MCAVRYDNWGGQFSVNSCNGGRYTYFDGDEMDAGSGHMYPFGSLLVMPGCTFYMFKGSYSDGISVTAPYIYDSTWGHGSAQGFPNGPQSWICSCKQEPISCSPSDGWEVIFLLICLVLSQSIFFVLDYCNL